ncbi:MAG: hypothetical protein J6B29_00810 [Clostridia bacterium]|nr:hypothetical protein [Clostridia bacterium]
MREKGLGDSLYKNAGYLSVALISLVYISSSLVTISRTGRGIWEIIGTGILSLIVGVMINGAFRSIGIRRGDEDERVRATLSLHAMAVEDIVPHIHKLDSFCIEENKRALGEIRARLLCHEGLKYSDYFDENGDLLTDKARECLEKWKRGEDKKKKKQLLKAIRVKIKPLASTALTSDGTQADNPFDFGKSKREYSGQRSASDMVIKLIMAIIFGCFGVSLVSEINVASVIWSSLQIILYITGGVIQMYGSYMWVIDDYRSGIIKKIDYLQKFKRFATGA